MINYGLISRVDANVLEKTIERILSEFNDEVINFCEVGLYAGESGNGVKKYIEFGGRNCFWTGIDNNKDNETIRFVPDKLIIGDSQVVYNQIENNSQHLLFVDALHTFPAIVADFFCYAPKVKVGGFLCFHDTGRHLDPLSGWQGVGDKNDPDFCLGGVRKALEEIGLIGKKRSFKINLEEISMAMYGEADIESYKASMINLGWRYEDGEMIYRLPGWELIFDEADPQDSGGGTSCFRKIY